MSVEHIVLLGIEGFIEELTEEIAIEMEDLVDSTDDFFYAADEESGARDEESYVAGQILCAFDPDDDFEETAIPLKNLNETNPRFKPIVEIAKKLKKDLKLISTVSFYELDDEDDE